MQRINLSLKMFAVCMAISLFLTINIGIFTYNYIMQKFDQEIEKFEIGQVEKTANSIRMRLKEFEDLGEYYAAHPYIKQFLPFTRDEVVKDFRNIKKLMDILSSVINSSDYVNDIFVYYGESEIVLNYSGIFDPYYFYETGWKKYFENVTKTTEKIDIRSLEYNLNLQNDIGIYKNNVLTFFSQIPWDDNKKTSAVVINLNYEIISDILKNATNNSQSIAFMLSASGTVLTSSDDKFLYNNINDIIGVQFYFPDKEIANTGIKLNGRKMVCYYSDVGINDWKLCIMTPSNIIFKKSIQIRLLTILVLALVLIIIIIASLLLSRKIYKPIKELIAFVKSESSGIIDNRTAEPAIKAKDARHCSDIFLIRNSMNSLLQDKKSLEGILDDNRLLFREYFLSNLITGKIMSRELIEKKAGYFRIIMDSQYYRVAAIKNQISCQHCMDIEEYETRKMAMTGIVQTTFMNENIDVICSQDTEENILVLIKISAGFEGKQSDPLIFKCIQAIKKNIEVCLDSQIIAGVGKVRKDILEIGVSYKESINALKYSFIMGEIVDAYDINDSEESPLHYPVEIEKTITSLIELCDYEKVMLCIKKGLSNIIDANRNIDHIYICFSNIINFVNRCIYDFRVNPQNIIPNQTCSNISISDFKNMQQFIEWLSSVFKKICEHHSSEKKESIVDFPSKMRNYIEKNYACHITLSEVSNHFGYNPSYFSRIFKENIGDNFLDYTNQVRIEKAKELLLTTNISTQMIAEQVGFNNRISFVRSFKKFTSVNPGEYRWKKKNM